MKLEVLKDAFSVCQAADFSGIDPALPYCFTARTEGEFSFVLPMERVPANTLSREDGWRGFRIAGQLDFSLIGILGRIASLLAAAKISIFAVSTYDTDYVFLKAEKFDEALCLLAANGYTVSR